MYSNINYIFRAVDFMKPSQGKGIRFQQNYVNMITMKKCFFYVQTKETFRNELRSVNISERNWKKKLNEWINQYLGRLMVERVDEWMNEWTNEVMMCT